MLISQITAAGLEDTFNKIDETAQKAESTINDIPKTPEEIKDKYLKKEWEALIAKNKVLGPIHLFLSNNQWLFKYTLNYHYELSLTFLCIFFLWLWITILIAGVVGGGDLFKSLASAFLGAVTASIVAFTGAINLLVITFLNLIMSQEMWWMRIILSVTIIAAFLFLQPLGRLIRKYLSKLREKLKKKKSEQKIETLENFVEGVKEGQKIRDEVKPRGASRGTGTYRST